MSQLIERTGDIFTSEADAIGHGVNVDGRMGAGIAVAFRARYPAMYEVYRGRCERGELEVGSVFLWQGVDRWVANIASQDRPGPHARLDWLVSGVEEAVAQLAEQGARSLALPQIGCGIGGLLWADVLPELRRIAERGPLGIEAWTFGG